LSDEGERPDNLEDVAVGGLDNDRVARQQMVGLELGFSLSAGNEQGNAQGNPELVHVNLL